MEATQVLNNRWMDKEDAVHIYFSAIKKNEILPFATVWMDLDNTVLSEISQRKTNTVYHLYVKSKK